MLTEAASPHGGQVYKGPKIENTDSMDIQKVLVNLIQDTGKLSPIMCAYRRLPCPIMRNQFIPRGAANRTKSVVHHRVDNIFF